MTGSILKQNFFKFIAQTSNHPIAIEPKKAKGIYIWDTNDVRYIDLISGFNVMNLGHNLAVINQAIQQQLANYSHLIVYGEYALSPQVEYAQLLTQYLPKHLNCVHFTNSGTEATEGALKLAKRYTGKTGIACFNYSYHGSTHGSLSVMGDENWRNAFRPLLPGIKRLNYNSHEDLLLLDSTVAALIIEPIQAEKGLNFPREEWLKLLQKICKEKGILIILDEIQSAFGRTGKIFAFDKLGIEPDILLLGKALGGGLPLGAFIADKNMMRTLAFEPMLGNISTFAGHPVCTAAGKAFFSEFLNQIQILEQVEEKMDIILNHLNTIKIIKDVRRLGMWAAIEFETMEICFKIIKELLAHKLITDTFIFNNKCLRLAPSLNLSFEEAKLINSIILKVLTTT